MKIEGGGALVFEDLTSYSFCMWTVVGHDKNKKYFENVVKSERLAHAYLFWGPEMSGKKKFAEDLFRLINNREPANDPDFKLISPRAEEEETKIYIDDIKELKSFMFLKPYYGLYKFVVINDADRMTDEASNALLKVLEEPTPNSIMVLISSKPRLILLTVLSRCEKVQFLSEGIRKLSPETEKLMDEFLQILRKGVFEKMQYAEKLYTKGDYQDLVVNLIYKLQRDPDQNRHVLKGLLWLNNLISQPQYNHRLALENFLINL